jgi:hypothetical protein
MPVSDPLFAFWALTDMEKAKAAPGNQHTGPLVRHEGSKTLSELGIAYDHAGVATRFVQNRTLRPVAARHDLRAL